MSLAVTQNVTNVSISKDTTISITKNITNVTATPEQTIINLIPDEITLNVSGNISSISVDGQSQEITVNNTPFLGTTGAQTINGSLTVKRNLESVSDVGITFQQTYETQISTPDYPQKYFEFNDINHGNQLTIGSIADQTYGDNFYIATDQVGLHFRDVLSVNAITPCNNLGQAKSNHISLGTSGNQFNAVFAGTGFFTGSIRIGDQSNNTLTAYEEGNFTLSIANSNLVQTVAKYYKIGDVVHIKAAWVKASGIGSTIISGLPFTKASLAIVEQGILLTPDGIKSFKLSGNTSLQVTGIDTDASAYTMSENGTYILNFSYRTS